MPDTSSQQIQEGEIPPFVKRMIKNKLNQQGNSPPTQQQKQALADPDFERIQLALLNYATYTEQKRPQKGRHGFLTDWFYSAPFGQPRRTNVNTLRTLAQSAWVGMCLDVRVDEIASLEWDIVPQDKDHPDDTAIADARAFFEHPNANQESFGDILKQFLYDLFEVDAGVFVKTFEGATQRKAFLVPAMTVKLKGEETDLRTQWGPRLEKAFPVGKATKGGAQLAEIYARDGASFLIDTDQYGIKKEDTAFWQYSYKYPASAPVPFSDREIVYVKERPRSHSPYGWSALQDIEQVLNTLSYSALFNVKFFEKGGVPPGILAAIGMNKQNFDVFKAYLTEEVKGDPHKLPMINPGQGGDLKWVTLVPAQKDVQFLETQEWYLKLVAARLKVNFNELGFTDTINRATAEEQSMVFRRRSLKPLIKLIEYFINLEIMQELWANGMEGTLFKFIPAVDLTEETKKSAIYTQEIQTGQRTINEVRRERGLEDVEWGDEPPWKHQQKQQPSQPQFPPFWAPRRPESENGEQEKEEMKALIKAALAEMLPQLQQPSVPVVTESISNSGLETIHIPVTKAEPEPEPEPVGNDLFYNLPNPSTIAEEDPRAVSPHPLEQEFQAELAQLFMEQEQEILQELGVLEKAVGLDKVRAAIQALSVKHLQQLLEVVRRFILRAIHRGGNKAHEELKLEGAFNLEDPDAERFLQDFSAFLAHSKYNQVRERIRQVILDGLEKGEGAFAIGEQVQKEFETLKSWEAERIARTEVMRAMNRGREIGYKRSGLVQGKQWLVTWDDRLCAQCRPMANQLVPLEHEFVTPNGLRIQNPPLHPNCRCTVVPQLRSDVGKSLTKYFVKTAKMQKIEQHYEQEIVPFLQGCLAQEMSLQQIADQITKDVERTTKMCLSHWTRALGLATLPAGKVNQHTTKAPKA